MNGSADPLKGVEKDEGPADKLLPQSVDSPECVGGGIIAALPT